MGLAQFAAQFASGFGSVTKRTLSSYSHLETSDGRFTLVAKDGSLLSILRVDGIRRVLGPDELGEIINKMSINMAPYLTEPGRAIQFWFARDGDLSQRLVRDQIAPQRSVAAAIGMKLDDLFQERERILPGYITWEGFHIALWTRHGVLNQTESKNAKAETTRPKIMPSFRDAQDPTRVAKQLRHSHEGFVKSFLADMGDIEMRVAPLKVHDALRAVKSSIYPDMTGTEWKAAVPGDAAPLRMPENGGGDISHFLWPRLDDQIFDREAERINSRIVRIGAYYFAALDMNVGPQQTRSFHYLLQRLIGIGEFPWRTSFLIEGGGLKAVNVKAQIASLFAWSNADNGLLRDAVRDLRDHNEITVTKLRTSFATWAPVGEDGLRVIEERVAHLQRAVEGWGNCGVTGLMGDPLAGVMNTAVGLDVASTAPAGAVPLGDVIEMLPWNRDASPWKYGAVVFRTPDGRPWPYEPGSSSQKAYIDLVFAPSGMGKSVLLNTTSLALCLATASTAGIGGAKLPRIGIIDIGPNSAGLISLIQESLPPSRRHEAAYHRLRMSAEFSINPFDTQPGCRRPLPLDRSFLVNFLTILGTEVGETKSPIGLASVVSATIDAVYEKFDDTARQSTPARYNRGVDRVVDQAIDRLAIPFKTSITLWWDIVDELFKRGDVHHSIMAQRHAVPRLEHLMTIVKDEQVMAIHGEAKLDNQERVVDVFARAISVAIKEYPILQRPTAFDIGDARVVALDLDEIAPKGGGPADKQTMLMYMLARYTLARDFYLNEDIVPLFPEDYRSFHAARIRRIKESPKKIVYDEFHRTKNSPIVREQVLVDMREGRKHGVHIQLASQFLTDFDKDMIDSATGTWILGANNATNAGEVAEKFDLSSTSRDILRRSLRGGGPFLVVLQMKEGTHEHHLINTLGPVELWAFSTTPQDAALRKRLYETLGPVEARKRLAVRFPDGTAVPEIESRIAARSVSSYGDDDNEDGIIDELAREIAGTR